MNQGTSHVLLAPRGCAFAGQDRRARRFLVTEDTISSWIFWRSTFSPFAETILLLMSVRISPIWLAAFEATLMVEEPSDREPESRRAP